MDNRDGVEYIEKSENYVGAIRAKDCRETGLTLKVCKGDFKGEGFSN